MLQATPRNEVMLAILGIEQGFETDAVALITEQDILGDRLVRPRRSSRKLENFISEVTSLSSGDLVVHVEHGIGRFVGLQTLDVGGAPHDCLELHYAGDTKLFLPVENIELLSRFGSEDTSVELDRLGGGGWQNRKARLKKRIQEIAGDLIKVAAERQLREAPKLATPQGSYDEFCAGFPYEETEDQLTAIDATLRDLALGRPMDRLVCGTSASARRKWRCARHLPRRWTASRSQLSYRPRCWRANTPRRSPSGSRDFRSTSHRPRALCRPSS
jgi:transcription-repair coupling factor (superfamily II helicase)